MSESHSDDLPAVEALGMLAAAQQILWDDTEDPTADGDELV